MKLSGWVLRILLIVMVGLSLVFTWLIWQNPSRQGRQEQAITVQHKAATSTTKHRGVVMAPTAAFYQSKGSLRQLFTPDQDVALNLRDTMKSWRLGKVAAGGKLTTSEYNALLNSDETLQLVYADKMAYQTFNKSFFTKKASVTNADFTFNRIIVNLAKHTGSLIFVNDATKNSHTGILTKHSIAKLKAQTQEAAASGFAVTNKRLDNGKQVVAYTQAPQVQPYVFLLDQQSANHYVSLLMPASATSNVDARELGTDTVYTAGTDYRLTLDTDTQQMLFDNAALTDASKSLATNLDRSYTALSQMALQGQTSMRYEHYDAPSKTVTYRSFAQGLPIYNGNFYGRVTVATTGNGQQISFSSNNLTVPIPTDAAKVTLPTTQAVLDHLTSLGYRQTAIQDLQLGYYWAAQDENSQVVNLTPTYFVEMNGTYRRYTQWLGPNKDKQAQTSVQAVEQE